MTDTTPLTRTVTFHALPGQAPALAEKLSQAAELVAEAPGCELWLVDRERGDPGTVRVTEMWASREECDAALDLPGVREHSAAVLALLDRAPEMVEGEPLGGARLGRGETGATRFAILDAPDLSKDAELLGRYELSEVGEARYVREELGARAIGLTHYRLRPGRSQGWAHRHGVAEEIYVVLAGGGTIAVDDERLDLSPLDAVRIAPGSARELAAGADGLEVLAFGSHVPGDGEMVQGFANGEE